MKFKTLFFFFFIISISQAQTLQSLEKNLIPLAHQMLNDSIEKNRFHAVTLFIPKLVEALKIDNSFQYPFDSLKNYISIIHAPDQFFRIFTWQLILNNGAYRYYGAIQMNSTQKLVLFPLLDNSDSLLAQENLNLNYEVLEANNWMGALYYNVVKKRSKKKDYYFLFGFDGNDLWSNKKIMEILWFDHGKPLFGAPMIQSKKDKKDFTYRHVITYKKDAAVSFNYNPKYKAILLDNLVAPDEKYFDLQFTFIPDGSNIAYVWKNGKWKFKEKIKLHNAKLKEGQAPQPKPLDLKKRKERLKK